MKQSNENLINIIQIETREGLDIIDEIAKLDVLIVFGLVMI